jgi:N-acetylglucosamine-6-sulfatase
MIRKRLSHVLAGVLLASLTALHGADAPTQKPNIIFILVDDLRWDELDYPFVKAPHIARLAREGARFNNAFVTTPLCSPSRASFLTGQYAHRHGITDNTDRSPRSHELATFPRLLHDAGYETAFVGKWHMGLDDRARPGMDYWVSVRGQGRYLDPEFNVNGERKQIAGYFTDILNGFATGFLKKPRTKPFLLYVSHKAVHPDLTQNADGSLSDPSAGKFIPAERHKTLYAGATIPHRPNHGRAPTDKPALLRPVANMPPLGATTGTDDETIRNRLRMLASVDEGLGDILKTLEDQNQLDNTLIVFTSDEGYFYGEHGLSVERRLAYEESIRIPLFMRWPKQIKPGATIDQFALNVDVAPTLLDIAGATIPSTMDGRSLLPLLRGDAAVVRSWRNSFLIEYWSDKVFPRVVSMGYQAVRTDRWKLIRYTELKGMDELYDLQSDPFETNNLASDPSARDALAKAQAELERLTNGPTFHLYTRVTEKTWPELRPFARPDDLFWGRAVEGVPAELRALTFSSYDGLTQRLQRDKASDYAALNLDGEYRDYDLALSNAKAIRALADRLNRDDPKLRARPLRFVAFYHMRILDAKPDIMRHPDVVFVGKGYWDATNLLATDGRRSAPHYVKLIRDAGREPGIVLGSSGRARRTPEEILDAIRVCLKPAGQGGLGVNHIGFYYDRDDAGALIETLRKTR